VSERLAAAAAIALIGRAEERSRLTSLLAVAAPAATAEVAPTGASDSLPVRDGSARLNLAGGDSVHKGGLKQ
jgi:hypothetical protein